MIKLMIVVVVGLLCVGCETVKFYRTYDAVSRGQCVLSGGKLQVIEEITWCVLAEVK